VEACPRVPYTSRVRRRCFSHSFIRHRPPLCGRRRLAFRSLGPWVSRVLAPWASRVLVELALFLVGDGDRYKENCRRVLVNLALPLVVLSYRVDRERKSKASRRCKTVTRSSAP
jgi:hypothetical protein